MRNSKKKTYSSSDGVRREKGNSLLRTETCISETGKDVRYIVCEFVS